MGEGAHWNALGLEGRWDTSLERDPFPSSCGELEQ